MQFCVLSIQKCWKTNPYISGSITEQSGETLIQLWAPLYNQLSFTTVLVVPWFSYAPAEAVLSLCKNFFYVNFVRKK